MGQRLTTGSQQAQISIQLLQEQLSSGQKFRLPSQSPTSAVQTVSLQRLIERRDALKTSQTINDGFLTAADQSLTAVVDALNRANAIVTAGIGANSTPEERTALANEVAGLRQGIMNAANSEYNGRFLFSGSQGQTAPFEFASDGSVRYRGDGQTLQTFADFNLMMASNVDGATAFRPESAPVNQPLHPNLTLSTRLSQLNDGAGVRDGLIDVTVDDGLNTIKHTVDLRGAQTLDDVKQRIESAFAAEAITVTVDLDPVSNKALRLTPSSGTIAIADTTGGTTAKDLGIGSGAVAQVVGAARPPELTLQTTLASLNDGAGIGATAGTGLRIVNGGKVSVVDLNGATTVEDLFNRIQLADPDVVTRISGDGERLEIVTRLSGAEFSIGENGGTNASGLGIRTMDGSTRLSELNHGRGVQFDNEGRLSITRRDGSTAEIDLTGSQTIQDVLDRVNAVDPGVLVASLNSVGNGISLTDSSGTGPLSVEATVLANDLKIAGSDNSGAAGVLAGGDPNPRQSGGVFSLLQQLENALRTGDNRELTRLGPQIEAETGRITLLRGEIGARQQILANVSNRMQESDIETKATLSKIFDADLTEVITQMLYQQQLLQGSLQVAAQSLQLTVLNYL
jgi:flagellar hook-associated protein 3 FlgL